MNESLTKGERKREVRARLLSRGGAVLAGAGWGRAAIEYDEAAKKVARNSRRGRPSASPPAWKAHTRNPRVLSLPAFVAGWTNRALGTEMEFDETKCFARGDDRCVFESLELLRPRKEFVE